jgi:hypothetical protein
MRISTASELDIKRRIKTRHYYIKQALNSIKLKDVSQMNTFCELAENEQKQIDYFVRLYPNYELSQCLSGANI